MERTPIRKPPIPPSFQIIAAIPVYEMGAVVVFLAYFLLITWKKCSWLTFIALLLRKIYVVEFFFFFPPPEAQWGMRLQNNKSLFCHLKAIYVTRSCLQGVVNLSKWVYCISTEKKKRYLIWTNFLEIWPGWDFSNPSNNIYVLFVLQNERFPLQAQLWKDRLRWIACAGLRAAERWRLGIPKAGFGFMMSER